ncbi:alpha/beta hydrolase [Shimia litoralis]|uniref:Alpha/beta hydrolase n=1 Tax=Shimia litoralis TaxID=420403 RepID=A0A4U7N616_9RHOB|nr:alpha/beta hydrolase [Shimia litoralis]TKZ21270.1 alpha/beta hydrolase [Shimia litoralis]
MWLGLAGILGLFVLFVHWKARRHERRAQASHPPEGTFLTVDGHRVHVVIKGSGPDLVLIHGASGSTRDMTFELVHHLSDRYRVIVFDRPGLGYTDRISNTGATLVQQADILSKACLQLGAARPIVMGQSYGGSLALAWAVHFPDRIAALVPVAAPSSVWARPLDTYYTITSHPVLGPLVIPLLTAFVSDSYVDTVLASIFVPQDEPAGYGAYFGPGLTLRRASLRANALQRANLLSEITTLYPRYGDIAVPTEILHGDADVIVPAWNHSERLVARIPDAKLTLLSGIGHMPHTVAPKAVSDAIDRAARRAGLH